MPPDAGPRERLLGRIPTLSIVMPAFNEERTVGRILRRVLEVELPCRREVIVVDDGSTDGTVDAVEAVIAEHRAAGGGGGFETEGREVEGGGIARAFGQGTVRLVRLPKNRGKGAALRAGFAAATGDYVVVQDADEEYDPRDLPSIVQPLMDGRAQAVYGSRVINEHLSGGRRWTNPYWYGGRSLTVLANLLFWKCRISDEPVCYKAVRMDVLRTIPMRCEGFEFCPEITAKLSLRGVGIMSVPIRYSPRGAAAGKKIKARHWWQAAWTMVWLRLSPDTGPVADFDPLPPEGAGK